MICTFFGHKDAPNRQKTALKNTIMQLIDGENVKKFYVGNNGNFDFLAQGVLKEIAKEREDIDYAIVLSYIGESALNESQEATVFPEELENTLPRFAISKRNGWLIKNSDVVITYAKHKFSNTYKWVEKAIKAGLKVINLAD